LGNILVFFAVPERGIERTMYMVLTDLPNIGAVLSADLSRAGIDIPEELAGLGAREAFLRLRMQVPDACLNRLYALVGAVAGVRWHHLPQETKDELKEWYSTLE
jgi:DNA transformation protein